MTERPSPSDESPKEEGDSPRNGDSSTTDKNLPPEEIRLDSIKDDTGLLLTEMDELEVRRHDRELKKISHITKNRIALFLVIAFILSLPLVFWIGQGDPSDSLKQIYYHWITVLASLTGASIGVSAISNDS